MDAETDTETLAESKKSRFALFAKVSIVILIFVAIVYGVQEFYFFKEQPTYVKTEALKVNNAYEIDLKTVEERRCKTAAFELVNLTGFNMDVSKASATDKFVAFDKSTKQLTLEIDQTASLSQTAVMYVCEADNTTFTSNFVFHKYIRQ